MNLRERFELFFISGQTGYHKSEERVSLLDKMYIGAKMGQYNNFLQSLAKHMTPKVFLRIKNFVKGKFSQLPSSVSFLHYIVKGVLKHMIKNLFIF